MTRASDRRVLQTLLAAEHAVGAVALLGGGVAAVVARAVVVDVAKGDLLAKVMSIMMALGGLAPMVAPVLGGAVLTLGGTWRTVFWFLVGFGLLMVITATAFVPESLRRFAVAATKPGE